MAPKRRNEPSVQRPAPPDDKKTTMTLLGAAVMIVVLVAGSISSIRGGAGGTASSNNNLNGQCTSSYNPKAGRAVLAQHAFTDPTTAEHIEMVAYHYHRGSRHVPNGSPRFIARPFLTDATESDVKLFLQLVSNFFDDFNDQAEMRRCTTFLSQAQRSDAAALSALVDPATDLARGCACSVLVDSRPSQSAAGEFYTSTRLKGLFELGQMLRDGDVASTERLDGTGSTSKLMFVLAATPGEDLEKAVHSRTQQLAQPMISMRRK